MSGWLRRLWDRIAADYSERLDVSQWSVAVQHLFDSLLILLVASLVIWVVKRMLDRVALRFVSIRGNAHRRKINTINSLILSTIKYTVYIAALIAILAVWGVNTQGLIVGSAVIGAAVGFGSQGLVQDVITGLSILAEEQLAVGDYVEIAGKAGAVEEVGLRVVKLRDHLGVQHVIFNRTITLVSNYTTGSLNAVVDIMVENMAAAEQAKRVANQVCRDLARELPYFPELPQVEGVQQSSTGDVFLRLKLRVLPQQQDVIQTMFVDRLKRSFATAKLMIPDNGVRVFILSELFTKAIHKVDPKALPPVSEKLFEGSV
jgi:moderate conductance mechanosensitive channel